MQVDEVAVAIDPGAMVAAVTDECIKEDDMAVIAKAGTPTEGTMCADRGLWNDEFDLLLDSR